MPCSVACCLHYSGRAGSENVCYFRFPKSKELSNKWKQFCRRADGPFITGHGRICSDHFVQSDFRTQNQDGTIRHRTSLREDAVPTVFACLPENSRPATTTTKRLQPKDRTIPSKRPCQLNSSASCQTDLLAEDIDRIQEANRILKQELDSLRSVVEDGSFHKQMLEQLVVQLRSQKAILQEEKEKLRQNTDDRVKELEVRLSRQEFRAEKFEDADFSIQKLTGLSSFALMKSIFYDFSGGGNDNFLKTIEYKSRSDGKYPNRKNTGSHRLNYFNQYFLTLFKLRTGMTDEVTGAIFGISRSTGNRYYNVWINVMHDLFRDRFEDWPYSFELPAAIPTKMKNVFSHIDLIIDCFETKIQTPKNPDAARRCFSNYKKSYTLKILVGIETDGNACFISHSYMGAISDLAIVRASGLLERLQPGAVVLADRGFQLVEEARARGIQWIVPPSKTAGAGFQPDDMIDTLRIARARILVERWIRRMRIWKQLDGPVAITEIANFDKEISVVSHLCKFLPSLIRDFDMKIPTSQTDILSSLDLPFVELEQFEVAHLIAEET